MRGGFRAVIVCLMYAIAIAAAHADSSDSGSAAFQDRHSKDVLRSMRKASTSGHPDQTGEFQGLLHFSKGDYAGAMKDFLLGAKYADKLSQLCIGLMYLNGNGVQKDPVTAYAWFALAAERNYPNFVATRDQTWARLNTDQRKQAMALAKKLSSEYGDAVAKPRMATQLRQDMLQDTESRTGYDDGLVQSFKPGNDKLDDLFGAEATNACMVTSIAGAPLSGCHDILANDPLKPSEYFRSRDAAWRGTVTVGQLGNTNGSQTKQASTNQTTP